MVTAAGVLKTFQNKSKMTKEELFEVKTWEAFEEIGKLLRSVRNEDPEDLQFHPNVLKKLADVLVVPVFEAESILIELSNFEQ